MLHLEAEIIHPLDIISKVLFKSHPPPWCEWCRHPPSTHVFSLSNKSVSRDAATARKTQLRALAKTFVCFHS